MVERRGDRASPSSGERTTTCASTRSPSPRTSSPSASRRDRPRVRARRARQPRAAARPAWFKRAVFYEVLIRGFADSNGDGTGDIRGLTEKLDYLQWLGVDCIWLLPIYESPLRDGGYDISDFMKVLPEFGDLGDFVQLVDEAHKRGMRIIADLVMNHSSDQHPWFQASRVRPRRARTATTTSGPTPTSRTPRRGSSSSTPRSPTGPRTRCASSTTGTASSATSRTSTTRTPPCRSAMIEVLKFWLDLGIDGFRLDAVPYLFEERRARTARTCPRPTSTSSGSARRSTRSTPTACMLCEANQWPEDVVEYFGDGRRRVPDGLPLPADAAPVHGRAPGVALPDLGDPGQRRRRSRRTASGASSCATTTS